MADYLNIAGRVRTTAFDGVAMEAQEVKDLNQNKSQQEINADVQTELGDRYTKEETYSKEQLDDLITTPDVTHVSVVATNATTAVTDILPATGEANTIYRVGNWDGTQYDPTMYALFAWNGSAYVCLAVRSFVGEVYDISVNHPDGQGNPTHYADLTAALGTNGANIPADIRRGGMSIKFIQGTVQSFDNKYIQFRYMSSSTAVADFTNVANWQGVEDGVKYKSENFPTSGSVVDTWLAQKGVPSNQPIFDVIEEFGYFPGNSITPVHFESTINQISALLFEFDNTNTEEIYINAVNKSIIACCHFLNSNKSIIYGHSIVGGSADIIGTVTKPQGAKYIAITNYMSVVLFPYVTGTKNFSVLRGEFYSLQGSYEKAAEFNGNAPYCYLPANSLVPVSYYTASSKCGVRLFKFKNTNEEKIFLGIINVSPDFYTHFLDSNKNIIQGSSIQGVEGQYRYKGIVTKPQGAQYIAISNFYNYCPQPFVSGTTEYNDILLYNIPYSFNSIFDVTENSYFGENSIVPISIASTQKMGTFIAEFQNTDEEDIYINAFNISILAYCHFLDSDKNIIQGSSIVGISTNTDVIGNVTKPQGAKYIAVTNYFAFCPYPYITGTVSLLDKLGSLQNEIDRGNIYPYIFDIDFVKNKIDTSIIIGSYTLSGNGATIVTGYSNRLNITRWASADNCSIFAEISLVNSNSKICLSTIDDVHASATSGHGSFVVFNFEDSKIQVYPRTTGDEVPQMPLQELSLDNINGTDYILEIGRKDRQFYAAVTNNKTCSRKEIIIAEPTVYTSSTETDPAGWMKDTPCISLLSGSCYIRRITGIVKQSQVIFLGDSITEGLKNEYSKCWCKMVIEELGDGTNFADSGRQIDYCQRVVDSILPFMKPKFVVVTIGTNGGDTLQNLSALKNSILELGAIPIFNHIPMGSSTISVNSMIDSLKCDGSLFDVATATNNVPSDGQNSSLFIDGVHPNVTGNRKMYERFITDLKYLLYRKLT